MRRLLRRLFPRLFFRLLYRGDPPWDTGITPPEVVEFIEKHPAGRALDLGCGTGTNAITLARGGWEVRGIDFIASAVEEGRQKARMSGVHVELITGSVTDARLYDGLYDLILDIGCYHSVPQADRAAYRKNVSTHLSPGGTYMLYAFDGPGRFGEDDLAGFQETLTMTHKEEGEERGERVSAWYWFQPHTGAA